MHTLTTAQREQLDRCLDGIEHLPPAPVHMIKLINLFQQPDRDVDEIVDLLLQEPALAAEILRRCNSSFFGNEEPVNEISEALFRLGFYEIYRLTVTLFGSKAMSAPKVGAILDVEEIWRHCTMTAIVGGTIAKELGETEGIVFTAGLLHDIGKIVLALAGGRHYANLVEVNGSFGKSFNQAERNHFDFNHAEVGAWLLGRWNIPEQIIEPVFQHHRTRWTGDFGRPAAIVNLADLLAHLIDDPGALQSPEFPDIQPSLELLKLKTEDLQRLEALARSDLKRSNSLLNAN